MYLLIALLLGVIEGVTEFLPVSSTGHLIVFESVFDFHDIQDLFTVVVQLGAIAAVIWFYRTDLLQKIGGFFKRDKQALLFWKWLVIATIPGGLVGLAFESSMEHFTTPFVVASMLIIGGIILWLVDRKPADSTHAAAPDFKELSTKRAILVGLGQCLAIVPGVSRSGATIVTGLLTGLNRPTATAFSFYLSIPILVVASGFKLAKYSDKLGQLPGGGPALLVGLAAAFVTALISIAWLLKYVSWHNFKPFAYYRIAFGFLIFALLAAGVIH